MNDNGKSFAWTVSKGNHHWHVETQLGMQVSCVMSRDTPTEMIT